jgi:Rab proteins geranylgeranyltransferase component A
MAGALLENEAYDAIIIGTGLPESILSAALSVSGARVLHLDPNPFYGSHHATLPLRDLRALAGPCIDSPPKPSINVPAAVAPASFGSDAVVAPLQLRSLREQVFPFGAAIGGSASTASEEHLPKRVFVDLAPRVVLGAGPLVDLLIQTGVGHYLSFRPLDASMLYFSAASSSAADVTEEIGVQACGKLEKVPGSRSDIFQSRFLSNVEKRLLMRFLKASSSDEPGVAGADARKAIKAETLEGTTFEEQMDASRLTELLRSFLCHSIAFTEDLAGPSGTACISAEVGFNAVSAYHQSLIHYATPTPFLYPNYGSGEICEAFCRLSAVHGGTFVLRRGIDAFVTGSENKATCGVVTSEKEELRAPFVFVSSSLLPPVAAGITSDGYNKGGMWRFAGLLDKSAFGVKETRILSVFPKGTCGNVNSTVRVLQMNATAEVCPDGSFMLSAECVSKSGTESDLRAVLSTLVQLNDSEAGKDHSTGGDFLPGVVWSVMYTRNFPPIEDFCREDELASGISPVRDIRIQVGATGAILEAERCFRIARPEGIFFPPPPLPSSSSSSDDEIEADQTRDEIFKNHENQTHS